MDWDKFEDIIKEKYSDDVVYKSDMYEACEAAFLLGQKEPAANVPLNCRVSCPAVDEDMLIRAVKKAVEVGIFPKHPVDEETYLKHWNGMRTVLQTAVGN